MDLPLHKVLLSIAASVQIISILFTFVKKKNFLLYILDLYRMQFCMKKKNPEFAAQALVSVIKVHFIV